MAITLPNEPDGSQFEDFVAATLRGLGYFIETRVILREGKKEILELDVVATPVGHSFADRELFEAKKDGISFPNLFKLYGQRLYLGIGSACLASFENVDDSHRPVYDEKAAELGVRVCCHRIDYNRLDSLARPRNALFPGQGRAVVSAAWYLQIAKRLAQAAFFSDCKANKGDALFERIRSYGFEINSSFFAKSPLERAEIIYGAYFNSPKLSGQLLGRLVAEGANQRETWNELNDTHRHLGIQYQMLLESSARIAIIKHALDDVVERRGAPPPTLALKTGSNSHRYQKHGLPPRFVEGLQELHRHPHSLRLPYLFQVFAELFGGFIVQESQDELAWLEAITGVPSGDIISSLRLMDKFFAPQGGSMFYTQFKGRLVLLKMVPGFVRGIGSFLRMELFKLDSYDSKYNDMGWLLAKWHNAAYHVLEPELAAKAIAA